jgi:hypothetical protein
MTGKTEFSRGFLGILSAFALATLVMVFFFEQSNGALQDRFKFAGRLFSPIPWIHAGGVTIANGLTEFRGGTPDALTLTGQLQVLFSLLLIFVVGPTLFFLGWRTYRLGSAKTFSKEWMLMVLGGILSFSVMIPAIPGSVMQRMGSQSMYKAQAVQTNKDEIVSMLGGEIQLKVELYRILPKAMGGGGGSFSGFVLPPDLARTEVATFTAVATDSILTIKATSLLYPNATASVQFQRQRFANWEWSGDFE